MMMVYGFIVRPAVIMAVNLSPRRQTRHVVKTIDIPTRWKDPRRKAGYPTVCWEGGAGGSVMRL